jgi:hypothetical protein
MVKFQVLSYRGEEDESSNVRSTQHHVPAWEYAGREFEPTNEVAWKRKAFCAQQYGKLWARILKDFQMMAGMKVLFQGFLVSLQKFST